MTFRKLRVVAGRDYQEPEKLSLQEARKHARPYINRWLQRVEHHVMAGILQPIDYLTAKAMTNCGPSANDGYCYKGQTAVGEVIGACARTARSSQARLLKAGLLDRKRGGPGRTASWRFCVNGKPIFRPDAFLLDTIAPIEKQQHSAQERQDLSGLERQDLSDKPSELHPIEHDLSPSSPTTHHAEPKDREEATGLENNPVALLDTGIDACPRRHASPCVGIPFDEFWLAVGRKGKQGPARSEWRKLTAAEQSAVMDRLAIQHIGDCWACVWLKDRGWEEELPKRSALFDALPTTQIVTAKPGSALWREHRARLLAAGDTASVKFMDGRARDGDGITIQVVVDRGDQ